MERDMDTMDFQVIAREQVDEPRVDKKKKISNFYVNGKYKIMASLYNFVHTCMEFVSNFLLTLYF